MGVSHEDVLGVLVVGTAASVVVFAAWKLWRWRSRWARPLIVAWGWWTAWQVYRASEDGDDFPSWALVALVLPAAAGASIRWALLHAGGER